VISMTKPDRKPPAKAETAVSALPGELETRISKVVDLFDSKLAAANAAGLSADQFARQLKGLNKPFFENVRRLCLAAGVSLDWLATGQGPMMSRDRVPDSMPAAPIEPLDLALLNNLVTGLERFLLAEELELDPDDKGRLVVLLYQLLAGRRKDAGPAAPVELRESGHPVDIARDVIMAGIVRLAV